MLDAECVRRVSEWLASATGGVAWLTGAPASGMSTMVADATRHMEAVWIAAGTHRSRAFFRDVCSSPVAVSGKRKVLVFDELDVLLGNEPAMTDVAHVIKHASRVPVVCILKNTRAATGCDLAKKAALVVHFPAPTQEAMVEAVTRVAVEEGLPGHNIADLCRRAPGDVRHVLQTMRAGSTDVRAITMPTADAVAALFRRVTTVREALTIYEADAGGVPAGVFETYAAAADTIEECLPYLDMLSAGDVVDERIHGRHDWSLFDVYGALTAASAITLPRADVKLARYGVQWNKHYMQCTKAKQLKGIVAQRATDGLATLDVADLALVRGMVLVAVPDADRAARMVRGAGLDAATTLGLMRLWDCGYKLSFHNRLRKILSTQPT
jgi:hypothetical protein